MQARAIARHIRIAPRKVRIVVDLIRGKSVSDALTILKFVPKRASKPVERLWPRPLPTLSTIST